jgi:WD40 repeat protein
VDPKAKKIKEEDFIDETAEVLDPNLCITFVNAPEIKDIEVEYFNIVKYESSRLFGGSLGSKSGGVTALAIAPNGRLVAEALTNGAILIYDTRQFDIVRIFTSLSTKYI